MIYFMQIGDEKFKFFVCLLIDVKALKPYPLLQSWMYSFAILESILLSFLLIIYIPYLYVIAKSKMFHVNLTRIIVFTKVHTMLMMLGKLTIILWELGIVEKKGDPFLDLPLIIVSLMRLQAMSVAFTIYPTILVERICSVVFMWDYERNARSVISTSIIISVFTISIFGSIFGSFFIGTLQTITIIFGIPIFLLTMIMFIWSAQKIRASNTRILDELSSKPCDYALSARYQAAENIRSFQFIRNFLYFSIFADLFGTGLLVIAVLFYPDRSLGAQMFGAAYEAWTIVFLFRLPIDRFAFCERLATPFLPNLSQILWSFSHFQQPIINRFND